VANAKTANWSALDRASLCAYFYSLGGRIIGKKLTPDQIHKKISKHIKLLLPVRIKKHIDAKILQRHIYMGGMYYSSYDKSNKPSIEVNFSYHPFDEFLKMTEYRWKRMSIRFADVVLHEMIHMRQFRARNFKSILGYQSTAEWAKDRRQQEYLGDRDEMGAFAYNIACEMIDRFGYNPTIIKQYMDTNGARRHKNSWWYTYLKGFDFDHQHKIIIRMKRKILHQLENAYLGKPFKTNDWLTY
jgi:hypothetical protein